jgi:uncharacterized protein YukE
MTVNPLVAARVTGPTDTWSGVWIAEDIELIGQGVRDGSWIDASLGVVGASLDGLGLIDDPVGALLQYGVSWLIEHVKPLSEALDWLAGDPAQIAAHAQTWRNVASALHGNVTDLAAAQTNDIAYWRGPAAQAYQAWAGQQRDAITGLAKAAETMAIVTEAAAFLVAGVRYMVRNAIATVVSRLIVYAGEEAATFGLGTPIVVEQVTTLVASWASRIAGWLRALLASLRRLMPIIRRLGDLINDLKKTLGRLRGRGDGSPRTPRGASAGKTDELQQNGVKHNPSDIVHIGRNEAGQVVFLENGNSRAGLQHIVERHEGDFANVGVPKDKIAKLVFAAVTTGRVVGGQRTRPIYEVMFEGKTFKLAVSVGDNGFIVGANPVGH